MGGNSPVTNGEGALRPILAVVGLLCVFLAVGCADLSHKPSPSEGIKSEGATAETPSMDTSAPAQEEHGSSAGSTVSAPTEGQATPGMDTAPESPVAKAEAPAVKPTPASAAPAPKPAPEPATEQASPPLDLKSLEKRLKETSAIGIFTKLALKNQVDDLLDKFRDFYQGRSNASLSQLRQPYEMLIMKALAILQDGDPVLARDILESREAIWKVLTDREKFAQHSL